MDPTAAESSKVEYFKMMLLDYWQTYGRKELPWRLTTDPWKILTAEVLLRKTTSRQAIQVYAVISDLSPEQVIHMPETELIDILKPLGLYRIRAKQLKMAAEMVSERGFEGLSDPNFLSSLPGIGRYISSTVQCFSWGVPKPALDTNMIRVIQRVFSYKIERSRAREDRKLWDYAESLVPENACREYNWAVLDLAAGICTSRDPKCSRCPLNGICDYANKPSISDEQRKI